jgi:SH3-like domain-containing protein
MSITASMSSLRMAACGLLLMTMTSAWGQGTGAQGAGAPPVVRPHGSVHALKASPADIPLPLPPPPAPPAPALAGKGPAAPSATPAKPGPVKPPPPPQDPDKGSNSGLPVPRFVSLRAAQVNLRSGPGERYPIEWVYQRRDLPVEIEREFDIWRLVRDADGVRGWVQEVMVMGRRSFVVTGADRTLRHDPDEASRAVAILKVGVIGRIRVCAAKSNWCQVQVDDYRGWLRRDELWGTLPGEAVGN